MSARDVLGVAFCLAVLAVLAVVALPPLFFGQLAIEMAIIDLPLTLDTAQRWRFGQLPHIDYQTPIGIAFWLVQGLGVEILGHDPRSLFAANILSALAIGACGTVLVRRRMSKFMTALLMVGVLLIIVSPRLVGGPPGEIAFLAPYNKTGLALLAILMTAFLVEPRDAPSRRQLLADIVITAFLLIWLIYLKLNFALIAVACGIAAGYFAPANRAFNSAAIVLGAGVAVAFGVASGLGAAYLHDIQAIAAVNPLFRWQKLPFDLAGSSVSLIGFLLACGFYLLWSRAGLGDRMRTLLVALGMVFAGVLAMNQVHESALPLIFVALLGLAERARREPAENAPTTGQRRLAWLARQVPLAVAGLLVVAALYADVATMVVYRDAQAGINTKPLCTDGAAPACRISLGFTDQVILADLPFMPVPVTHRAAPDQDAIAAVARAAPVIDLNIDACAADGRCIYWLLYHQLLLLLNQTMTVDDKPLFLGFANFLPYFYDVEPPRHVLAWFDMGRSLSADIHPDPDRLFADVTLLAIPDSDWPHIQEAGLEAAFAADIDRLFVKIAETDAWSIWRKKEGGTGR